MMCSTLKLQATLCVAGLFFAAQGALADPISDHLNSVQAQQNEERRLNDMGADMGGGYEDDSDYGGGSFAATSPEVWDKWVIYSQEADEKNTKERFPFLNEPGYQKLLAGTWTYRADKPGQSPESCVATFWTLAGGASFIHVGGSENRTFFGIYGWDIPAPSQPQLISMELIQSGKAQRVKANNVRFGVSVKMGLVLFDVQRPDILIGAIKDSQDYEVRINGATVAKGAWHDGLKARNQMASCLKSQGYLPRK